MTKVTNSPLDVELHIPAHLDSVIAEVTSLYETQVAPREAALKHRLKDQSKFLDEQGRLHPEIIAARREIMAASGAKIFIALTYPSHLVDAALGAKT